MGLATEIVASGMSVSEWSLRSGVGKTCAYRALNWCRVNDPSVFGAGEAVARESDGRGSWYESVRSAIGGTAAGVPGPEGPAHEGRFVSLGPAACASPASVTVSIAGATISLPAGCAEGDAYAAVSAVARALGVAR